MTNAELIQTIRAEIERRVDILATVSAKQAKDGDSEMSTYYHGKAVSLEELISFLSTLESEKPMQEGLDGEIEMEWDSFNKHLAEYDDDDSDEVIWLNKFSFTDIARHFAEWGAEHTKIDVTDFCKPIDPSIAQCIADHSWEMLGEDEKPVPNDLEEAAKKYATEWHENPDGSAWKPYFEVSAIKAFIAGAKWQKEQDMDEWLKDRDGCFWDGVEEGKKAMKEQMLKEAVAEVEVGMRGDPIEIILDKYVQRAMGIFPRDKVRIIVLPKED